MWSPTGPLQERQRTLGVNSIMIITITSSSMMPLLLWRPPRRNLTIKWPLQPGLRTATTKAMRAKLHALQNSIITTFTMPPRRGEGASTTFLPCTEAEGCLLLLLLLLLAAVALSSVVEVEAEAEAEQCTEPVPPFMAA